MLKTLIMKAAIVAFLGAISFAAFAVADTQRFDVPPGELAAALESLAKQANVDLVYQEAQVKGLRTKGVSGNFSAHEAITKLLEGTPLQLRTDEASGAILITTPTPSGPASTSHNSSPRSAEEAARDSGKMRIAQADEKKDEASKPSSEGEEPMTSYQNQELPAPEERGRAIPEILVKGSKVLNSDIRRSRDDPQPYVVLNREQIERSQAANVEELLQKRLPMNTAGATRTQAAGTFLGSQSTIDLRGLGADQTLILVDGRRMPSVAFAGSMLQPDINGIPMRAIERIEILPSTASGIFGGGATGGVINIITRKDYSGLDVSVEYGDVFESDAPSSKIEASSGFSFEGGRTQVLLAASHADRDSLLNGDRDFTDSARALLLANNPSAIFSVATPPIGYTSNIRSQNGANLVLDPAYGGIALNSPVTHVPVGYAGASSDGAAALVANAGQYNLAQADALSGAQRSLLAGTTVDSAMVNVRREFGSSVEAFLDISWRDNQGSTFSGGVPFSVTLPANAANNPFTTPVVASFPATGLSLQFETESELRSAKGGVIVRLPRDWSTSLDYVWSKFKLFATNTNPVIGDPDGAGPATSGATALANGTLDVMRDLNQYPLDFSPYLLPSPNNNYGPGENTLRDLSLRVSGPIVQLPAGPLTLSSLVERRWEEADAVFLDLINSNAVTSATFLPQRSQTVTSYYLETRFPLFSSANAKPLAAEMEFQASARHDDYESSVPSPTSATVASHAGPFPNFGSVALRTKATKYTLGFRYAPAHDLAIRASYGTGFLPPSLAQIVGLPNNSPSPIVIDPKRGGVPMTIGPISQIRGADPNLKPEDSESWSAGAIFTPRFLPDFRLSLDFTRIEKTNEIDSLGIQGWIDFEDFFPGRVRRDPLTPEDAALGYTAGAIREIDGRLFNFAVRRVEAYDMQADYTLRTDNVGSFHLSSTATYMPQNERKAAANTDFVETVGFTRGSLEWRANFELTWEYGPWTAGWNTQYYDSYWVYPATANSAAIAIATVNQGSSRIPSQTYHDMFARYRFSKNSSPSSGVLDDLEITLGIQNVFDTSPPIVAAIDVSDPITGAIAGYSPYGDPRMRRYSITVRKSFGLGKPQ